MAAVSGALASPVTIDVHSQTMTIAAAVQNRTKAQPPSTTAAIASTAITTDDATRLRRSPDVGTEAAESARAGSGAGAFTAS